MEFNIKEDYSNKQIENIHLKETEKVQEKILAGTDPKEKIEQPTFSKSSLNLDGIKTFLSKLINIPISIFKSGQILISQLVIGIFNKFDGTPNQNEIHDPGEVFVPNISEESAVPTEQFSLGN